MAGRQQAAPAAVGQAEGPTGAQQLPQVLPPARLTITNSGSNLHSHQGSPMPLSPTPPPTEEVPLHSSAAPAPAPASAAESAALEGSTQHRSISIHADGSAHGGRRYFDGPAAAGGAAAAASAGQQPRGDSAHSSRAHQAIWVVEDGSQRSGRAAAPPSQPDSKAQAPAPGVCSCCGCPCGGGGGSSKDSSGQQGQQGQQGWGGAKLMIEEADERKLFSWGTYFSSLPKKLKGGLDTRLPVPTWRDLFWSWLGAFLGILAVCGLNQLASPEVDIAFLVGSFGASAVLVFAVLESKMSQPRNFLGGQLLSSVVGITTRVIIHQTWIAGPVGMSLALLLMQLTSTTHPPGGATALIAATMTTLPRWHGYSFIITVLVGSCVMQAIALVVNNLDPRRRYPTYWY